MASKKPVKSKSKKLKITEDIENNLIEESSKPAMGIDFKKSKFFIIAALVILILTVAISKGLLVAAIVNGQPITRFEVINELEKQTGKQTLQSIVTKTLITQEAKKQNVTVSDDEVNAELEKAKKNIEASGQKLEDILALQGLTLDAVKEQIKVQKIIEKLLSSNITVEDKEVDEYIAQNQEMYATATDTAQLKETVKEQLKQQKLTTSFQTWLADLEQKASVKYLLNY